jgi:hypothetical protein
MIKGVAASGASDSLIDGPAEEGPMAIEDRQRLEASRLVLPSTR